MTRNDQLLNLGRALVNSQRPHVAIKPLHDASRNQAVATVDLQCLIDNALRGFRGVILCH